MFKIGLLIIQLLPTEGKVAVQRSRAQIKYLIKIYFLLNILIIPLKKNLFNKIY